MDQRLFSKGMRVFFRGNKSPPSDERTQKSKIKVNIGQICSLDRQVRNTWNTGLLRSHATVGGPGLTALVQC